MLGACDGGMDPAVGAALHPEHCTRFAACRAEAAEKEVGCEALLPGSRGFVAHRATATGMIWPGRHVGVPMQL